MISRKIFSITGIILITVFLSGCTLSGQSDGGVYKSTDGGFEFEQKVFIDEENSIARANILDVEIDPDQEGVVYVGTERLGILRTINSGESWVRDLNEFNNVMSIKRIPRTQTIYVAAKLGNRGKVFKTDDGGENWKEIYTEKVDGGAVGTIAYDYNDPNILYIGTSRGGIFKTKDGGLTWKTLLWAESGVRKIAVDQVNPSIVYFGTTSSGALISKNAGEDFLEIKDSGSVFNIATHPSKEGTVFLSDDDGLIKSSDFGENWEVLNTLVKPEEIASRGLAINSNNSDEIFYSSGKAFYKSVNGGETWKPVQFDMNRLIREIEVDPHNSNVIYLGTVTGDSSFSFFPG